jgi:very-short-patch-repair endonuclease
MPDGGLQKMAFPSHRQSLSFLESLSPGQIRTVLCNEPTELMAAIELSGFPEEIDATCSMCRFEIVPEMEGLLSEIVGSLARIAAAIFPGWYGGELKLDDTDPGRIKRRRVDEFADYEIARERPRMSSLWLQEAIKCCSSGKLPLPTDFAREQQAAQLAMAIGGDKLFLVLAVEDRAPRPERILGLAKGAEWFTRVAGAGVLVLAPHRYSKWREMQSLLYHSVSLPAVTAEERPQTVTKETKHVFRPFHGNPHPFSPGEQLLAKTLSGHADLAGLFAFNQTITTVRDSRFVVDLLWDGGKMVVEVDGYGCHGSRYAFGEDRHRDYELLISGFLVLRLTHEEIVRDPSIAVDKIRDVVRFRRRQFQDNKEAP